MPFKEQVLIWRTGAKKKDKKYVEEKPAGVIGLG